MRLRTSFWVFLFIGLAPAVSSAEGLPASFSLGRYVPGDWWMYLHFVKNPEREWLDAKEREVWRALQNSGIDKDILSLIASVAGEEERAQVEGAIAKAHELLGGVQWDTLASRELVIAERVKAPLPDWAVLARGAEGSGEANAKGLAGILGYLDSILEAVEVVAETRGNVQIWTMKLPEEWKYSVHLLRKGDVVGFVTNRTALNEIVQLLEGAGTKPTVVETPRFKDALAAVKAPENSVKYCDFKLLQGGVDGLMREAFVKAGANPNQETEKLRRALESALGLADFLDYNIVSQSMDGRQEFTYSLCKIQSERAQNPICRSLFHRKAFEKFDKFIPAEATRFELDSFVDIPLLYATALDFVEKFVPDGAELVQDQKRTIASFGFDPERDVFSWWGGETIMIELPAAVPTSLGGSDMVFMVRVKDPAKAREKLDAFLHWGKTMIDNEERMKLPLTLSPVTGGPEGFRELVFAPLAMFVRPVIGVADEFLTIGSSSAAVTKCLDVAAGKAPSISKNERFASEGIVVKGPVMGASFVDTSRFSQEMGAFLGMMSFAGKMAVAQIPAAACNEREKQVKSAIGKGFDILMKLGPVFNKIDYYSSESSVSTVEGLTSRSEKIVTYKDRAGAAKSATNDSPKPRP